MVIPAALLRRFYVDGSLHNSEAGFSFHLRNRVAPTTLVSLGPVEIDGEPISAKEVTIVESKSRRASEVSTKAPLVLPMGKQLQVVVPGRVLGDGEHEVLVHAMTREVGSIVISVVAQI